jgi:hypothetical protein
VPVIVGLTAFELAPPPLPPSTIYLGFAPIPLSPIIAFAPLNPCPTEPEPPA